MAQAEPLRVTPCASNRRSRSLVFSLLAFGAGVGLGQVLGASDRLASYPSSVGYTPADLAANVLEVLGVDMTAEIRDAQNRQQPINAGTAIPWS